MILETEGLTKDYAGGVRALDDLTLSLPGGATGLLGPNGAGKSTLIRILLGLLRPSVGRARLLGIDAAFDPLRVRQQVGYMPENESLIPGMNAVEYVRLAGRLVGMSRQDAMQRTHLVLNYVGLDEERYRPMEGYSTGMKQKAKLAQALVHHPKLLLLDEPTAGLDPRAREEMLGLVRDIARYGVNVVLSTHILPDVERVCAHIAILNRGRLVRQGRLEELVADRDGAWQVRVKGEEEKFRRALAEEGAKAERLADGTWRVEGDGNAALILRAAVRAGVQVRHLGHRRNTLEELFAETIRGAS